MLLTFRAVAYQSCVSLEGTVKKIENALAVPLIQATLFSARNNELHFKKRAYQEFYPEGYVLAHSILPIINDADLSAAAEIKNVMVAGFPSQGNIVLSNDSAKVHGAIKSAVSKIEGFDCTQLGSLGGSGFCTDDDGAYNAFLNSATGSNVSILTLSITFMLLLLAFV